MLAGEKKQNGNEMKSKTCGKPNETNTEAPHCVQRGMFEKGARAEKVGFEIEDAARFEKRKKGKKKSFEFFLSVSVSFLFLFCFPYSLLREDMLRWT